MIRTLCTLHPGTKQDGTRCLKGELSRSTTTTAADGTQRTYPVGTPLVLTKNANGSYSLLAMLDDQREALEELEREIALTTEADREQQVPF